MTTASPGTIAVFGATGNQGGAVTDALLAQGARVRALVRDPGSERARALADQGVEPVRTDIEDPGSLREALTGVEAFFFMTTMHGPDPEAETRQGIALADAAAAAAVPHVVFDSVGGAERESGVPHFESKRRVEEHLQHLDLPTTIIRPVFFMENLGSMGPTVEDGEVVVRLPLPDAVPLQMISVRDVGAIAAAALLGTAEVRSGIEIAADELTGSEIAAAVGERAGLPARYEALPLSVLDGQDDVQAMFRWFAQTPAYQADLDHVRSVFPRTSTLREWLTDIELPSAA